jgi:hypothetical protein
LTRFSGFDTVAPSGVGEGSDKSRRCETGNSHRPEATEDASEKTPPGIPLDSCDRAALEKQLMNRRLPVGVRRRPLQTLLSNLFCRSMPSAGKDMPSAARLAAWPAACGAFAIACLIAGTPARSLAADLSKDIRTATDLTPYAASISGYVHDQVALIGKDEDPKQSSTARDSLIDEVRGLVDPSPQFLDAYEAELRTQLTPLLDSATTPNVRVRLNAAIVVANIAAKSEDAQLAQLVVKELNDPSEAVVLWGLKAAHDVLPPALSVPNLKVQLIAAIKKAAERLATGPIVAASYNALAISDKPGQSPADLIEPVQSLLAWRIAQYAGAVPPEPPADSRATTFLTQQSVWSIQSQAQQLITAQQLVDLIGAAAVDLGTAQPEDHDELINLLAKAGGGIFAIGYRAGDQALETAATPLSKVDQRPPPAPPLAAATMAINGLVTKYPALHVPKGFTPAPTAPAATPKAAPAP